MEAWVALGVVVGILVFAGFLYWYFQRRQSENHFHLFRTRLVKGEYSVLAENVRQQTLGDLANRLTFLRTQLEDLESQRYTASAVADLHHDDVMQHRRMVKEAEHDYQMAEFLEKKFRTPEPIVEVKSDSSGSVS